MRHRVWIAAIIGAAGMLADAAAAAEYAWGGGGANWYGSYWNDTSAAGWNGGPPGTGDVATVTSGKIATRGDFNFPGTLNIVPAAGQDPWLYVGLSWADATVAQLNMYGGTLHPADATWSSGSFTLRGPVAFYSNTTVNADGAGGSLSLAGVLNNGIVTGNYPVITKSGNRALTLQNAGNAGLGSDWNVQGGTLVCQVTYQGAITTNYFGRGSITLSSGAAIVLQVTVNGADATLNNNVSGTGTVQWSPIWSGYTVRPKVSGAALSPGAPIGTLTFDTTNPYLANPNLAFEGGTALNVDIGGTAAGVSYDQFRVNLQAGTRTLTLSSVSLNVSLTNRFTPADADTLTVIDLQPTNATLVGKFSNDEGAGSNSARAGSSGSTTMAATATTWC